MTSRHLGGVASDRGDVGRSQAATVPAQRSGRCRPAFVDAVAGRTPPWFAAFTKRDLGIVDRTTRPSECGFLATSQIGDTPSKLSEPLDLFACDSDPLWGPFAIEGFDRVPVESSTWIRFCDGSKGPCTIALQFP